MGQRSATGLVTFCLALAVLVTVPPVQAVAIGVNRLAPGVTATRGSSREVAAGGGTMGLDAARRRPSVTELAPPETPRIALYGDSLVSEAGQDFAFLASKMGASVRVRTFPGTATCDFLPSMAADALDWRPTTAVLAFSGDSFTPCMADDQLGTPQYYAKYEGDTQTAISIFRSIGAKVILIGLPLDSSPDLSRNASALNRIYQTLADDNIGVTYNDAGEAVLANGQFTWTLPCLPGEPCTGPTGTNIVRAPDGVHFCPNGKTSLVGGFEECDVYSSGALRFASAILASALPSGHLARTAANPLAACRTEAVHLRQPSAANTPRATTLERCRTRRSVTSSQPITGMATARRPS